MSIPLPDLSNEEMKPLVNAATSLANSMNRKTITSYLIVAFTQNAALTAEVNRLRAMLNLEPLKVYKPEAK